MTMSGDITSFFTAQSLNADGSVTMLATEAVHRKSLYLTNQHGQKLFKLSVKSEAQIIQGKQHAQLKVITYGVNQYSSPKLVGIRGGIFSIRRGFTKEEFEVRGQPDCGCAQARGCWARSAGSLPEAGGQFGHVLQVAVAVLLAGPP